GRFPLRVFGAFESLAGRGNASRRARLLRWAKGLQLSNKPRGRLPKWPTGADCKSAGLRLRWFESITYHHPFPPKEWCILACIYRIKTPSYGISADALSDR